MAIISRKYAFRKLAGGHWLLSTVLTVPKQDITTLPGLKYKYAMIKGGKNKGKQVSVSFWSEHGSGVKQVNERCLCVPFDVLQTQTG